MDIQCSSKLKKYFKEINNKIKDTHNLAEKARLKSLDPEKKVEVPLAKNMAERVVGLISVVCSDIVDTNLTDRIVELENEYGLLDWRVGFKIAEEVAKEKFCKFKDRQEAIEIGIRTGFAYLTDNIKSVLATVLTYYNWFHSLHKT